MARSRQPRRRPCVFGRQCLRQQRRRQRHRRRAGTPARRHRRHLRYCSGRWHSNPPHLPSASQVPVAWLRNNGGRLARVPTPFPQHRNEYTTPAQLHAARTRTTGCSYLTPSLWHVLPAVLALLAGCRGEDAAAGAAARAAAPEGARRLGAGDERRAGGLPRQRGAPRTAGGGPLPPSAGRHAGGVCARHNMRARGSPPTAAPAAL
jgi:hypothetical protein